MQTFGLLWIDAADEGNLALKMGVEVGEVLAVVQGRSVSGAVVECRLQFVEVRSRDVGLLVYGQAGDDLATATADEFFLYGC